MQLQVVIHGRTVTLFRFATSQSLSAILDEFLAAKSTANRSPEYVRSLRQYMTKLNKEHPGLRLSDITPRFLESWFSMRAEKPTTMRSNIGRIGSLFSFAMRRGYARDNPIKKLELPTVDHRPPEILTPAECRTVLERARPDCKAAIVLMLFGGLRPSEAEKLQWEDIDLERSLVQIKLSKIRRWRMAPLSENATLMLEELKKKGWPVFPSRSTFRRGRRKLRLLIPQLGQDTFRHTAASYLLARDNDAGKVAMALGNSPSILHRHYKNLVSRESADEFWAVLVPTNPVASPAWPKSKPKNGVRPANSRACLPARDSTILPTQSSRSFCAELGFLSGMLRPG